MHARAHLCMTAAAMFICVLHHRINVSIKHNSIALSFLNISARTNVHDLVLCTKHNNWRKDNETQKDCTTTQNEGKPFKGFLGP
eukprot:4777874-Amphidinium_carterae.1